MGHPQFSIKPNHVSQLTLLELNEELSWKAKLTKGDLTQKLVHHRRHCLSFLRKGVE